MSANTSDLLALRNALTDILNTVPIVAQRVFKPPIIYEPGGDGSSESNDDDVAVPGLKVFEGTVEKEIDVLDKVTDTKAPAIQLRDLHHLSSS